MWDPHAPCAPPAGLAALAEAELADAWHDDAAGFHDAVCRVERTHLFGVGFVPPQRPRPPPDCGEPVPVVGVLTAYQQDALDAVHVAAQQVLAERGGSRYRR